MECSYEKGEPNISDYIYCFYGYRLKLASYILSQGSPDKTKQALSTIISAIVGLVITIIAATIVSFVAGSFSNTAAPTSTPNTNQNGPR
ncbi:hypothetical protein EBS40_07065 [bacterium]|nr:hypothetical protein [bacterium]